MNTADFLSLVWPEAGPYLIAIPVQWHDDAGKLKKGFRHYPHDTPQSAATHAQALATDRNAPRDTYFALGSIKDANAERKRHASNIDRVRAFWLDIDIKPDQNNYTSLPDAMADLKAFVRRNGLPKPYVVHSGGGLHVYWPMTESIEADKWQHYASLLKAVTKRDAFRVDQTRTADRASVLRPAGTYNFKREDPVEVRVVVQGEVSTPKQLLAALARMAEGVEVVEHKVSRVESTVPSALLAVPEHLRTEQAATTNASVSKGTVPGYTEADPKKVVRACQQLRRHIEQPEAISEPEWYAMIGCMRHAKRGPDAVHLLSSRYPAYNQQETEDKIAQHEASGAGPTLCATFESHNPGGCNGCPFKGKVKTPLLLGRERVELETPKLKVINNDVVDEVDLPDPPAPYKRALNTETGKACVVMQVFQDLEVIDEVEIFPFDLYPSRLMYDEREQRYQVGVTLWLPHRGELEFFVPTGLLYDRKALATLLGNKGALPDLGKVEHLVQYMVAYIRELQKRSAGNTVYAQLGWRGEGRFVLPDCVITPTGVERVTPSAPIEHAIEYARNPPKGDLDTWKRIVGSYDAPGREALQFGFGVAFASPLLHFTPFAGMIVSLWGERGTGKSSAVRCANSVWGHPKMGWIDMEHDTGKAFYNKIGVLNNLPVTYDEITNLDPRMLSDLCYAVSKGRGRQRLKSDGTASENFTNWQTMMITTANASLHNRLAMAKDDASAEAVRVFEYRCPPGTMSKREADDAFDQLAANYGLAGPVYAQHLVRRYEWARERVRYWIRRIDEEAGVTSGERFWSAGAACILTGFELANEAGLTAADVDRLHAFALRAIRDMRDAVAEVTNDGSGALNEYLSRNIRNVLTINNAGVAGGPPMIAQEPVQELRVRVEAHTGTMFIDRSHLRRFLMDIGLDPRVVAETLKSRGILKDTDRRMVLGRGTKWRTGQTWTWVIDLNHPSMGEVPLRVIEEKHNSSAG